MFTYKHILLFIAVLLSVFSYSQEDTSKTILIQEIVVQGKSKLDIVRKSTDIPDLQTGTDKILEDVLGVTLIKRGNFAQEPTIRGLNPGQINTTIDGMQMFGACTDHMDPISSYVEPTNLKSVNLKLGPNEEQFGSSIGGGFDFKLRKAQCTDSSRLSGLAGLGYETNASAFQTLASLEYSQRKWAIQSNFIYRKAGNYYAGNNQEIRFSQYEKWNLGVNALFAVNEHHSITLDYIQDEGSNIGYPALTMDVAFADAKIGAVSHLYKNSSKKMYRWESKLYANYIDHAMDDTRRPAEMVPMHMDMPGTSFTSGFYSNTYWKLGQRNFFSAKVNAYQNDLHAEMTMYPASGAEMFMLTIPDARREVIGVDLSNKFYVNNKTKITYGGRLEMARSSIITEIGRQTLTSIFEGETTNNRLIYSAFVQGEYKFNSFWNTSVGISKAMRSATLQEMYGFYLFNRMDAYDYLGNPDIRPEESWNFNASVEFKKNKFQFRSNLFSYFFTNYIIGYKLDGYSVMTIGGKGVKQYDNIPSARLFGFEVYGQYQILKNLVISSSNSFTYGENNVGEALPFIPPFKSLNTLKYTIRKYQFSVESRSALAQNHTSPVLYGELPSTGFHVLNINAGKSFVRNQFVYEFKLTVDNIFDTSYYEHLDVMKINRQGRNFLLHVTVRF